LGELNKIAEEKEIHIDNAPYKIFQDLNALKEYMHYLVKEGDDCID
jgi:hypothetical protein